MTRFRLEDPGGQAEGRQAKFQGFQHPWHLAKAYADHLQMGDPVLVGENEHLLTYRLGEEEPGYYIRIHKEDASASPLLWDAFQLLTLLEGNFNFDFPPQHERVTEGVRNWLQRYGKGER